MDMDFKVWAVGIAILLSLFNYARYLRSTFNGVFRPHMFSWGVWSILACISLAAQVSEGAGPGMWQTASMAAGTMVIAIVAYFKGERDYTRSDWIALIFALFAIPLWLVTDNPLWSVILITVIDAIAIWPTLRKSWADPHRESTGMFFIAALVCGLGFAGLDVINLTTGLYQAALVIMNLCLVLIIMIRRNTVTKDSAL